MTDDEAAKVLREERNYYFEPELIWLALTHALVALSDRAALVERLAAICERKPLVAGEPLANDMLDAARRHMEGK